MLIDPLPRPTGTALFHTRYPRLVGSGGGVPWFKLRPRSLDRTLDDRDQPGRDLDPSRSQKPTGAFVLGTGLIGIALVIVAVLLWGFLPVLSGIAIVFGIPLLVIAALAGQGRRRTS
jgi:hypothetical protein